MTAIRTRHAPSTALTAVLTLGGILSGTPAATAQDSVGMEAVAFMTGCWQEPGGDGLREFYLPAAVNMMTGLSQFWRDGRIVDWEFHRIDLGARGPILTPHPRGVESVAFAPESIRDDGIVWQNLEHDFPNRIAYRRLGSDTLVARVDGGEGGEARVLEFRMIRVPCP